MRNTKIRKKERNKMKNETREKTKRRKKEGKSTERGKRKRQRSITDVEPKLHRTEAFVSAPPCFRINIFTNEVFGCPEDSSISERKMGNEGEFPFEKLSNSFSYDDSNGP